MDLFHRLLLNILLLQWLFVRHVQCFCIKTKPVSLHLSSVHRGWTRRSLKHWNAIQHNAHCVNSDYSLWFECCFSIVSASIHRFVVVVMSPQWSVLNVMSSEENKRCIIFMFYLLFFFQAGVKGKLGRLLGVFEVSLSHVCTEVHKLAYNKNPFTFKLAVSANTFAILLFILHWIIILGKASLFALFWY